MGVKVGSSYVSEAAYNYAALQKDAEGESSDVMKSLAEKFPNLKFTVGTAPFAGTGLNNVSISPKILRQMEKDPDKRMEYEALLYDIAHFDANAGIAPGRSLKSHGFVIGDDGGLRSWGISAGDDEVRRNQGFAKRSDEKNWWQKLLPVKKESSAADTTKKATGKEKKKSAFADVKEFSRHLAENFAVVKGGMAKISSRYLRDCLTDEDKRQKLFDNLRAADASLAARKDEVGFQGMQISVDDEGNVTSESSKSTVSINEEKSRRQIAAAATKGDMEAVLARLYKDLQDVEEGLKKNMCDEAEVEKAKKLIEAAKEQMARLPDRESTPEEQTIMSINVLI